MSSEEMKLLEEAAELGFTDGYDGSRQAFTKPEHVPEGLWRAWQAAYDGGYADGLRAYRRPSGE